VPSEGQGTKTTVSGRSHQSGSCLDDSESTCQSGTSVADLLLQWPSLSIRDDVREWNWRRLTHSPESDEVEPVLKRGGRLGGSRHRTSGWHVRRETQPPGLLHEFDHSLAHDRGYTEEETISVAEEAGINMCLHPDDPPVESLGGVRFPFCNFGKFK